MRLKGLNCAETAIWALGQYWNNDLNTSYGRGLGGGVARLGETCGALTVPSWLWAPRLGGPIRRQHEEGVVLSPGAGSGTRVQR